MANRFINKKVKLTTTDNTTIFTVPTATTSIVRSILVSEYAGSGSTLKYFVKRGGKCFLEAANPAYDPIELDLNEVIFQGKLLAVWRKI